MWEVWWGRWAHNGIEGGRDRLVSGSVGAVMGEVGGRVGIYILGFVFLFSSDAAVAVGRLSSISQTFNHMPLDS